MSSRFGKTVNLGGGVFSSDYRIRAARALGKPLPTGAVVHHHDPRQLVICQSQAYHLFIHARTRIVRAGGNPDTQRICSKCGELKDAKADFSPTFRRGRPDIARECKPCAARRTAAYYQRVGR